jgi:hypothetical protein
LSREDHDDPASPANEIVLAGDPPGARLLSSQSRPRTGGRETQLWRMSKEVRYLLGRLDREPGARRRRLRAEAAWWADECQRSLPEVVRRGFLVRQLCLQNAGDGTWRSSLSYIGDQNPADEAVCVYEYDRADVRFAASSPLARPYPWADEQAEAVWYARTGMSAIVSWLIAAGRMAAERGRRQLVLTNRLYYETCLLFQSARLADVEIRSYPDTAALLAAVAAAGPVAVFLDSSRPGGGAAVLSRVLAEADAARVGCVVWDNTCMPAAADPFGHPVPVSGPRTTLLLIRSHTKLDQLGLELCSLGSITMLPGSPQPTTAEASAWREAMRRFLPDCLAVTGSSASPSALRLLAALGLPNFQLSAAANQRLREANTLAGRLLAAGLKPTGRYWVEQHEHGCFAEIHIPELPAPALASETAAWPAWVELKQELAGLERQAARYSVPIWKSASFGFHYTGLSWYPSESQDGADGRPHTVVRVCVGMHDPEVTAQVAALVAERLAGRRVWPGAERAGSAQ